MIESTRILVEDIEKEVQTFKMRVILQKAKDNCYHDFLGSYAMNMHQLADDLRDAQASRRIIRNVLDGKYDATKKEAEDWAKSPEGIETFNELFNSVTKDKDV